MSLKARSGATNISREFSEFPTGSEYVQVIKENAKLVKKKTSAEVLFTRLLRSSTELVKQLTEAQIAKILAAKTDARLLLRFASTPEVIQDIAPVAEDMQYEVASSMGPEAVSTLAMLRGLAAKRELIEAAGGTLRSQQVAKLLGISRQAVHKKTKDHELLALSAGKRGYVYPAFQFTKIGKVVPGLRDVLTMLDQDPWGALIFLLEPDEELRNMTPIEALRKGHLSEVVAVARLYGEQGGH